jgi:U2 small nuclear ribonucleoprotein A'
LNIVRTAIMRITTELIANSIAFTNPLKERELDLRGHKIPLIENLGAAGSNDCIDFTDNDINSLGNFPLSPRLKTLLCARNRISHFQPGIARNIPNLETLVLMQNAIANLEDLEPLADFKKLVHLTLWECPVTSKEVRKIYFIPLPSMP